MTKAEIVKSISESTGVDKQASMALVESFMEIVKESLAKKKKKKKNKNNETPC